MLDKHACKIKGKSRKVKSLFVCSQLGEKWILLLSEDMENGLGLISEQLLIELKDEIREEERERH